MVIQARRRFVIAFVVALFLALFLVTLSAQVAMPKPLICNETGPGDLAWWLAQCYLWVSPDSFANRPFTGFLIR